MVVVSNTTPLNYLILIEAETVLLQLFARVLTPPSVISELSRQATPLHVRQWIAHRPPWLEQTTFRAAPQLMVALIERDAKRRAALR